MWNFGIKNGRLWDSWTIGPEEKAGFIARMEEGKAALIRLLAKRAAEHNGSAGPAGDTETIAACASSAAEAETRPPARQPSSAG